MTTKALVAALQSEDELQRQVLTLARLNGWTAHHSRPAMNKSGKWSTPIQGDVGLPDLLLLRPPRLIFAELKTEKGKLTAPQEHWLEQLRLVPGIEVYLWKPSSWSEIEAVLR